jgi:hypothetical protein
VKQQLIGTWRKAASINRRGECQSHTEKPGVFKANRERSTRTKSVRFGGKSECDPSSEEVLFNQLFCSLNSIDDGERETDYAIRALWKTSDTVLVDFTAKNQSRGKWASKEVRARFSSAFYIPLYMPAAERETEHGDFNERPNSLSHLLFYHHLNNRNCGIYSRFVHYFDLGQRSCTFKYLPSTILGGALVLKLCFSWG